MASLTKKKHKGVFVFGQMASLERVFFSDSIGEVHEEEADRGILQLPVEQVVVLEKMAADSHAGVYVGVGTGEVLKEAAEWLRSAVMRNVLCGKSK